ncbi:hypothetical protein [Paraburkholderia sediminicola]|uniref:hypothetical protein n=1 Tax=Paraburkholderia sediminicola TaxID=458836 RepID=UPI0038BBB5F1
MANTSINVGTCLQQTQLFEAVNEVYASTLSGLTPNQSRHRLPGARECTQRLARNARLSVPITSIAI